MSLLLVDDEAKTAIPTGGPFNYYVRVSDAQTFSVRACARTRTRACAAIFVQIGAENFSEK